MEAARTRVYGFVNMPDEITVSVTPDCLLMLAGRERETPPTPCANCPSFPCSNLVSTRQLFPPASDAFYGCRRLRLRAPLNNSLAFVLAEADSFIYLKASLVTALPKSHIAEPLLHINITQLSSFQIILFYFELPAFRTSNFQNYTFLQFHNCHSNYL
jgi:hypothetical protein